MEKSRIVEIEHQITQLKSTNPEVYGWIESKHKQQHLQEKLNSSNPNEISDVQREELNEVEKYMVSMKKKYSSIQLYEALLSTKQQLLNKEKDK